MEDVTKILATKEWPTQELVAYALDAEIGIQGFQIHATTDVWLRLGADEIYEARQGFDMMDVRENKGRGPFDDGFMGAYYSGRATTRTGAIVAMLMEAWKWYQMVNDPVAWQGGKGEEFRGRIN